MTIGQRTILRFIDKNFAPGTIRTTAVGNDKIKVTDRKGESIMLTMNIYCDIMDADTGSIYARSSLPHDINKIGNQLPADWTEVIESEKKMGMKKRCRLCDSNFDFKKLIIDKINEEYTVGFKGPTSECSRVYFCPECGRELTYKDFEKKE